MLRRITKLSGGNMNNTNKIMLKLLNQSLFNKKCTITQPVDWNSVINELKLQSVLAIPYSWAAKNIIIDEKIKSLWLEKVYIQAFRCMKILEEQNELIKLLRSFNIDAAIMKGSSAAVYYPEPEFRAMGDIDFIVKPEDFDKCHSVMLKSGFEYAPYEKLLSYHISFVKNDVHFELHKNPAGITESEIGKYLKELIFFGMDDIVYKQINEHIFPSLPRLQNGLVLLLHIEKHLKEGLGLRQIIDWMMFVNTELTDDIWETEFKDVLEKSGLDILAVTVTRLCQLYLGLRDDNITWCKNADEKLCSLLLDYILEQGNFGVKKGESQHGVNVISRTGSAASFIKSLQTNGINNWESLKKHPSLKCFAWLYQIFRYIKLIFKRENSLKTLYKDFQESRKRKKMLKQLGCYNTE